ncbi:hypothetical protein C8F04DRAFT_1028025 [Mycena alexandri]|uniref:F-box domain-containing protein n=1 Tax=Mycena alexandri TaxID=1745969 RepID=A0AAD6THQ2_9AGAR|nr:hypothetical protein C8F04DRAFT_1028025 [Mycena alexandri]
MHIPEELICLILAKVYYPNPFSLPDYSTLLSCALVNSYWRGPSQTLLFRKITLEVASDFGQFADTTRNHALLSHVRILAIALSSLAVTILVSILRHCPQLYELSVSARGLFSLGHRGISRIAAVVRDTSIRSLRLIDSSVQSPILYELLELFPTVEFLTLGVEIASAPPASAPAFQLYELTLQRTPSSDVLAWLLSMSGTSLRILELRDPPSPNTHLDLATCCPHLQSLRLMRYNSHSGAILRQCTNLLELVILNVPMFASLRELPPTLEHFALLIQTYTASVDLGLVISAVNSLPRLRILTFIGDSEQIPLLQDTCNAKNVALHARLHKFWISDDPIKTTRFPRRKSVSNFYLMN